MQQLKGVIAHKGAPNAPDPGPGEAVWRVHTCRVRPTDVHYRQGAINGEFPFVVGHKAGRFCCSRGSKTG